MKIVLVRPTIPTRWLIMPPLGLMYISAVAKKSGHEVFIHDSWLKDEKPRETAVQMPSYLPDIIGIQVFSETVEWTRNFINGMLWRPFQVKIIIGGPYVSAIPEKALEEMGADVAIVGEFDNHIDDTLSKIMQGDVKVITMPRTDINVVPIPDWDAAPPSDYWHSLTGVSQPVKGKRIAVIQRTRGCPFPCTFCSAGFTMGKKVRFRDDDNVLDEIKYLQKKWGINEIWFQDDNVIVNYNRGINLFEKLAKFNNLQVRLPLGIRIENVDEPMVGAMKSAGVYFTGIGIESGNPRVLDRIKKRIHLDKVSEAIGILNKYKITTIGFFIFGLPTETRYEMEDTVKYTMNTKLNHAQFGTFLAYPGAADYKERSLLPKNELIKIQRNATLRFYLRPRIIWGMIKHIKLSQIKAILKHPWVRSWI